MKRTAELLKNFSRPLRGLIHRRRSDPSTEVLGLLSVVGFYQLSASPTFCVAIFAVLLVFQILPQNTRRISSGTQSKLTRYFSSLNPLTAV
jgi:hypothetical protein